MADFEMKSTDICVDTDKFGDELSDQNIDLVVPEGKALTENKALTFASSGDARVDFLFHVIEGSSEKRTTELLEYSWTYSPLDTMKLIMNTRDIRRGKGIRSQFLICLKWLYHNELDSLLVNLKLFPEFGCWKDLFNLLLIALFDKLPHDALLSSKHKEPLVGEYDQIILRAIPKKERQELNKIETTIYAVKRKLVDYGYTQDYGFKDKPTVSHSVVTNADHSEPLKYKSIKSYFDKTNVDDKKKQKKNTKIKTKIFYKLRTSKDKIKRMGKYRAEYFKKFYNEKDDFRRLYEAVVDLVGKQLCQDYHNLKEGKSVSLLAKWLPNQGRYFDKYLFIVLPIAHKFLQLEQDLVQSLPNEKQNQNKMVRKLYRKVCTDLRKALQVPELTMSDCRWKDVQYFHIPSMAMLRYRAIFVRNDFDRFEEFVQSNQVKGAALTPGHIIEELTNLQESLDEDDEDDKDDKPMGLEEKTLESQWHSLVENVKSKSSLIAQSLAICDVSGSMYSSTCKPKPIHAAMGLTLMMLQLSTGPWSKWCISFSERPKLLEIDAKGPLRDQIKKLLSIDFGLNTDLNKSFALLLSYGQKNNIPNDQMPKVLFIFTDMEFDQAISGKTNFESCEIQYREAGYTLPLIVFWNLKGDKKTRSTPVQCFQKGVFLLSGYSVQTINFFYTCSDLSELTPQSMLMKILQDTRYKDVTVSVK